MDPVSVAPEVSAEAVDPTVICRWCGFCCHNGRGPIVYIQNCQLCVSEQEVIGA